MEQHKLIALATLAGMAVREQTIPNRQYLYNQDPVFKEKVKKDRKRKKLAKASKKRNRKRK